MDSKSVLNKEDRGYPAAKGVAKIVKSSCTVDLQTVSGGEIKTEVCHTVLLGVVLEGLCSASVNGSKPTILEPGCIVLFPPESCYVLVAAEDTEVLSYRIDNMLKLWEGPLPGRVRAPGGPGLSALVPIRMNERLWEYAESMRAYVEDGILDNRFVTTKAFELVHLLQFYYPSAELAGFMAPFVNEDTAFIQLVFENWETAKSKDELAALAGLSPSRFGVKFKEVFGIPPYQWMLARRSEKILYRLTCTTDSLRQISEELHFASVQHFNDFCKKQLGSTPGKIRADHLRDQSEERNPEAFDIRAGMVCPKWWED